MSISLVSRLKGNTEKSNTIDVHYLKDSERILDLAVKHLQT